MLVICSQATIQWEDSLKYEIAAVKWERPKHLRNTPTLNVSLMTKKIQMHSKRTPID